MEYALLLGIVSAALVGMQLYAKRGVQAGVKMMTDAALSPHPNDLNGELAQRDGIAYESGERRNRATTLVGTVLKRGSRVHTGATQRTTTQEALGGGVTRIMVTDTTTTTGALDQVDPTMLSHTATHSEVIVSDPR